MEGLGLRLQTALSLFGARLAVAYDNACSLCKSRLAKNRLNCGEEFVAVWAITIDGEFTTTDFVSVMLACARLLNCCSNLLFKLEQLGEFVFGAEPRVG